MHTFLKVNMTLCSQPEELSKAGWAQTSNELELCNFFDASTLACANSQQQPVTPCITTTLLWVSMARTVNGSDQDLSLL